MLNELYTLARSLKRFNVMVEAAHPWVKRLGRADLLVAGVDAAGFVAAVEYGGKQTAVTLFKIQESNHSNFPAVNWPSPVWKLDRETAAVQEWLGCPAEEVRPRVELLRKACGAAEISPGQNRALSRVQEFCRELAPRFQVSDDGEFAAFSALLQRLLAVTTSAEEWLRKLSDSALGSVEAGSAEMLVLVETLLAGKFDRKKNQLQKAKVPILFDLADCTKFRHRVASPKFGGYFSQRLNATEIAGTGGGRCALTGVDMPIETDKMPSPRLPVLGDTVLMSMNPDTLCQTRYGRIGTEIFPLGEKTASELNSALLHLTAEGRKRKNWMPVPGTTKKKFNLLLVYLEASPLLEADIAEMFSGADESDALYTTVCARVSEALRGRATRESDLLHLFVLNKIDPGRVQVELNEAFTAKQVIRGGTEWEEGSRNRPALVLRDDDFVPSPTDVMKCLRMKWERSGASYSEAPGCTLADVYQLLIAGTERARDSAKSLLRMTLHRSADLLKAIGHAAHRGGKEAWKGISRDAGKNPIIAASLLGITLNKLGYRKESYMHEPAFLIGRFLSLADTLHAEYSKSVRDDLPPQLLGNALIPTAISSPNKGLARMLQRIRVYQAWARGKKGTGLARWSCGEMGKIANEVAGKLPARLNEAEQAQLLLGYLARAESNQEKASEEGANQ
jgi:hypothetical protein